jgi:UDP-3-O-[3-hydroxymyristoyl] N-acetylglucosamine deacetylase
MNQKTIAKSVEIVGIGLHRGNAVKLILEPYDNGILFCRDDTKIELKPKAVVDTRLATVIGDGIKQISTIEHLLSSLYAFGISNIKVIVDSDEMPVLDGSSIGFCLLLKEAGIKELDTAQSSLIVKKAIEVRDGDKFVKLSPSKNFELNFKIKFDHPLIKEQNFRFDFSKDSYIEEIARARTFGFLKEVEYLRSIGLAKGGSLDNAIVLDDKRVLNIDGLRFEDEFVRHKILDAIGDLSLLGYPIVGKYEAFASSHHLNHLLTLELLSDEKNYEIVKSKEVSFAYA